MRAEDELLGSLVDFCAVTRTAGLPVGTDDAMAFTSAVAALDPGRLEDVYWAGRITLVHTRNHIPVYDECFARYFMGGTEDEPSPQKWISPSTAESNAIFDVPSGEKPEEGDDEEAAKLGAAAAAVVVNRTKSFDRCDEDEIARIRRMIAGLRVRPPVRRSRRRLSAKAGRRLDLRRMARETMRTHGEPAELAWLTRKERVRPLVLILDISGSMADYSRCLLQFAHSTKRGVGKVEVFCFGTRLTRITHSLRHRDPDEAIDRAGEEVLDWAGGTRIGASLDDFVKRYARRGMARGAIVVICSDGLDRGDPALLDDALERLGRLSHRIVWMNPMQGDADEPVATSLGMAVALPHTDLVWSGHNLESLESFAEALPSIR